MHIVIDIKKGVRSNVREESLRESIRAALEAANLKGDYRVIVPTRRHSISKTGIILKGIRHNQVYLWVQLIGADGCCECYLTGTNGETSERIHDALLSRFPQRYCSSDVSEVQKTSSNPSTDPNTTPIARSPEKLGGEVNGTGVSDTVPQTPEGSVEQSRGEKDASEHSLTAKDIRVKNSEAHGLATLALQTFLAEGKTATAREITELLERDLKITLRHQHAFFALGALVRMGDLDIVSTGPPKLYKLGTGKPRRRKVLVVDDESEIDPALRHIVALTGQARKNDAQLQEIVEQISQIDLRVAELTAKRTELETARAAIEGAGVKFRETMRQLEELSRQAQALMEPTAETPPSTA